MNNKITPLELATGKTIATPEDIINGWEGTSKLLYCYKNDKDLIEWLSLLSDDLIENAVDCGSFSDLNEVLSEDFFQIGLYLNLMKKKNWGASIKQDLIVETINILLAASFAAESINRKIIKEWGKDSIPGSGKLLEMIRTKENKYDTSSYSIGPNPLVEIKEKKAQ